MARTRGMSESVSWSVNGATVRGLVERENGRMPKRFLLSVAHLARDVVDGKVEVPAELLERQALGLPAAALLREHTGREGSVSWTLEPLGTRDAVVRSRSAARNGGQTRARTFSKNGSAASG